MKRLVFLLLLCAVMAGTGEAHSRGGARVTFRFFYSSLSPHGEWIEIDAGLHAWRPLHVAHGWRPYLHGRWVWTAYGWYWVSNEPFGWAVFHYGRWHHDDFYGWIWIPDYDWGPAWVEWRYSDDYIGWAPLPPYATFSVSVGIRFTRVWVAPVHYWTFVGCGSFTTSRVVDHAVPVERTRRIFGSTRTSTRYEMDRGRVVNRGVDVGFVENRTGARIRTAEVAEVRERGVERIVRDADKERIEVYRPQRDDVERSASARIEARKAERPVSIFRENRGEHRGHRDDAGIRTAPDRSRTMEREGVQTPEHKPQRRIEGERREQRPREGSEPKGEGRSSGRARPERREWR